MIGTCGMWIVLNIKSKHETYEYKDLPITVFFRPPETGLCFTRDVFSFLFSPRFLRDPSTDRPETLPDDQNLAVFYKLTSKIPGGGRGVLPPPKNWGPKTCKIAVNFGPLQTLISNISGTRQHIQNRKDVRTREIPPALTKKVR